MEELLLIVRGLRIYFPTDHGVIRAVDGVDFAIDRGQVLGMVGESGCGKTMTALSIMRLVPSPGRIEGGEVLFRGRDLLTLPEGQMRRVRGGEISMVFQEPMTSLNPVFTCGEQIEEVLRLHRGLERKRAREEVVELLGAVGVPSPRQLVSHYPHQLSGGMRQRVMLAIALAGSPSLLIADEPTTALDVTVQAQILDLLLRLQEQFGLTVIIITHDLGVVAQVAQRVVVMYAGQITEEGPVEDIFFDPLHPYTKALLNSIPRLAQAKLRLNAIEGTVPQAGEFPPGCRFHPRCSEALSICREEEPKLRGFNGRRRWVRCWRI